MSISLSESAARHINKVIAEPGNNAIAVRLEVLGGGCSGYQYKWGFADKVDEAEDVLIELNGAKLAIDKTSLGLLEGCVVDYGESLMESGFRIKNPNAVSSCGCGSSFSVKE
ncbi:MAG: iron-sulfur cluster assembly accessory protein [Alphaproteobacteria bacterium]